MAMELGFKARYLSWWRNNKGLVVIITLLVVVGVIVYYMYSNDDETLIAPPSSSMARSTATPHVPIVELPDVVGSVAPLDVALANPHTPPITDEMTGGPDVKSSAPQAVVQKGSKTKATSKKLKSTQKNRVGKGKDGVAYLPMARKGEIPSPRILAERIRESLRKNASGHARIRGANVTPEDFLRAVQKAGGTVEGVSALPTCLESLVEGDMPYGTITMSRVKYARSLAGAETYSLDILVGHARNARKGERGWYDANSDYLIIAGDCSNSPLTPVKGHRRVVVPVVDTPKVVVPIVPLPTVTGCCTAPEVIPAPVVLPTPVPPVVPISPAVKKPLVIPIVPLPQVVGCCEPNHQGEVK